MTVWGLLPALRVVACYPNPNHNCHQPIDIGWETFQKLHQSLYQTLPKWGTSPHGMILEDAPQIPQDLLPLKDPLHVYLWLMRKIGIQVLSWNPDQLAFCDELSLLCHRLHGSLGSSHRRYGIATHIFLWHYSPWIERFGDTVGVCSQGGERTHQVAKDFERQAATYYKNHCPPAHNSLEFYQAVDDLLQPSKREFLQPYGTQENGTTGTT